MVLSTLQLKVLWGVSVTGSSELGLKPPGFEFRILCLEGNVISLITPSAGVLLAQFSLDVHKSGLKLDSFHFYDRNKLPNILKNRQSRIWN